MKRIRIATPLLLGFAMTLSACERQATETGEMEDTTADTIAAVDPAVQLDSLRIRYEEAWNARDMDAINGMMTSEYQEIGPEGTMDRDQAIAMMADSANMPPPGATLSIEPSVWEVAESGDVAYGAGVSTVTIPGADGQETGERAQWVAGFKRVDGEWKIDRLALTPASEDMNATTPSRIETTEPMEADHDTTGTM